MLKKITNIFIIGLLLFLSLFSLINYFQIENNNNSISTLNSSTEEKVDETDLIKTTNIDWAGFNPVERTLPSWTFEFTYNLRKNTYMVIYDANTSGMPNGGYQGIDVFQIWEDIYFFNYLTRKQTRIGNEFTISGSEWMETGNFDWEEYDQDIDFGFLFVDSGRWYFYDADTQEGWDPSYSYIYNPSTPDTISNFSLNEVDNSLIFNFDYTEGNNNIDSVVEIYLDGILYKKINPVEGNNEVTISNLIYNENYLYSVQLNGEEIFGGETKTQQQDISLVNFDLSLVSPDYNTSANNGAVRAQISISNPSNVPINSVKFYISGDNYNQELVAEEQFTPGTYACTFESLPFGTYTISSEINYTLNNKEKTLSTEQIEIEVPEEPITEVPTIEFYSIENIVSPYYDPINVEESFNNGSCDLLYTISYDKNNHPETKPRVLILNVYDYDTDELAIEPIEILNPTSKNKINFGNISSGTYYIDWVLEYDNGKKSEGSTEEFTIASETYETPNKIVPFEQAITPYYTEDNKGTISFSLIVDGNTSNIVDPENINISVKSLENDEIFEVTKSISDDNQVIVTEDDFALNPGEYELTISTKVIIDENSFLTNGTDWVSNPITFTIEEYQPKIPTIEVSAAIYDESIVESNDRKIAVTFNSENSQLDENPWEDISNARGNIEIYYSDDSKENYEFNLTNFVTDIQFKSSKTLLSDFDNNKIVDSIRINLEVQNKFTEEWTNISDQLIVLDSTQVPVNDVEDETSGWWIAILIGIIVVVAAIITLILVWILPKFSSAPAA